MTCIQEHLFFLNKLRTLLLWVSNALMNKSQCVHTSPVGYPPMLAWHQISRYLAQWDVCNSYTKRASRLLVRSQYCSLRTPPLSVTYPTYPIYPEWMPLGNLLGFRPPPQSIHPFGDVVLCSTFAWYPNIPWTSKRSMMWTSDLYLLRNQLGLCVTWCCAPFDVLVALVVKGAKHVRESARWDIFCF